MRIAPPAVNHRSVAASFLWFLALLYKCPDQLIYFYLFIQVRNAVCRVQQASAEKWSLSSEKTPQYVPGQK